MLDKSLCWVIEYTGIKYRDERKEYRCQKTSESPGHWLKARMVFPVGKCVRERGKALKVINESGTAADTASCTDAGIRGFFLCNTSMEVICYVFVQLSDP